MLVTGGPASGKTRLLEAIIAAKEDVGAYAARPPHASLVCEGHDGATLRATWLLSPWEQARAEVDDARVTTVSVFGEDKPVAHPEGLSALFRADARASGSWKVEYFHAGRSLPAGAGEPPTSDGVEAPLRLGTSVEKYRGVRAHLVEALLDDALALIARVRADGIALRAAGADTLTELRELVRPFLHGKVLDGIESARGGYRVRFRGRDGDVLDSRRAVRGRAAGRSLRRHLPAARSRQRARLDRHAGAPRAPETPRGFLLADRVAGQHNQIIAATSSTELLRGTPSEHVLAL